MIKLFKILKERWSEDLYKCWLDAPTKEEKSAILNKAAGRLGDREAFWRIIEQEIVSACIAKKIPTE